MSQSGLYFMLFSINLSTCPDLPSPIYLTFSYNAESQERPAQQQGHSMRAHTWLFRATVDGNLVASDSCPNSTFKALLDSRKARQEECLGVADTITFTCSDLSGTEPRTFSVEGFIHGCREIGGCSLNQWLPMNHIPELKAIDFEPVYPGHGQLDSTIQETSCDSEISFRDLARTVC